MGTSSIIGGCVCPYGCSVVVTVGWSDGVLAGWFSIYERSVCGICGGSVAMVLDGLGT